MRFRLRGIFEGDAAILAVCAPALRRAVEIPCTILNNTAARRPSILTAGEGIDDSLRPMATD